MKQYICLTLAIFITISAKSQCTVNSSDGYAVNISISPKTVNVSSTDCPWGYNYNLGYDYSVTFTGPNIPAALYTLQTLIYCNGQINGGYTLPLSGGAGSSTTTTNPFIGNNGPAYLYTTNPSCLTATVQTLQCNSLQMIIQGPGINYQVINCAPATALPVELVSFAGKEEKGGNRLTWKVQSEYRNSYFTVKHSRDGVVWTEMTKVESKGTTTNLTEYTFLHEKPSEGLNYYALSQTDLDGTKKELGITGVENNYSENQFAIFPNPAVNGQTTIRIGSLKDEKVDYILTDELGRVAGKGEITQFSAFGNRHIFEETITLPDNMKLAYISFYRNGEILRMEKIISL